MKKQGFIRKIDIFKKGIQQKAPIFILLLTILLAFPLSIVAENNFFVENSNKIKEYTGKLLEENDYFIEIDTEPTKSVSTHVATAINEYKKKMIDLQSHSDVEKRSLENEIVLSYVQGATAGRIAWVYYYNIFTFSGASADKISAKYASCQSIISNASEHTVLSAERDVMLNELNRLIYTERAQNLSLATDSLSASALISGATEKFKELYSADLFGEAYRAEYERLVSSLMLQRVRDELKNESERIFKIIRPSESFSTSPSASLLVYELENAKTVKRMNNATLDFLKELLAIDAKKPYSSTVKNSYLSQAQAAASRATETQSAASLAGLFGDYSLNVKKAEIKDSVYALLLGSGGSTDERLVALEQTFNKSGGIIDNCETDAEVEAELVNAKASLFAYKHEGILLKPFDEISESDESSARTALVEYSTLDDAVKQKLLNEINNIAEKYNNILILKITSYLPNDALYLDYCDIIIKEIKSIPRDNIADFYNKVTRLPQKAEALASVIKEYRALLAAENYEGYTESEKTAQTSTLSELSKALAKIDPADVAIYTDEISDAQASAIRKLNVIDQCVRVRVATRSSKSAEILSELDIACEKISLCSEKNEMIVQANRAIYKIQRLLTSDTISAYCTTAKESISAMQFLKSEEKESFSLKISALEAQAKSAREAENLTALEAIWTSFSDTLSAVVNEAEAIDLSRAISEYLAKANELSTQRAEALKLLEYIPKAQSDEIYNKILTEQVNAKQSIPLCKSTSEVIEYYNKFLTRLDELTALANKEDLNGYKSVLMSDFDRYEKIKGNYSAENYNKILSIKQATSDKLTSAATKTECDSIIKSAHDEILSINDLLDDEKDAALDSLLSLLESLKKDSTLYSAESFSKIEGLYDEGKIEIGKINDISKIAEVKQTLSKYITLIKGVNKDRLYTSESAHSISTPSLQYPDDYDYSKGLLGSVQATNGLISDARLSISLVEQARSRSVEELIRRAAKRGELITRESISRDTLKLLRSSSIAATLDISLSSIASGASEYTLQMLVPNSLCGENILGLAFITEDDEVEFYPTDRKDSLISVDLQHFSKYYVVVESTLNVKPLLITLMILLGFEFLILIAIIYLRYKRKANEEPSNSDLPELPMSAVIPLSPVLTRVYPENGIPLAILLTVAALALASTIALLIRKESKEKQEKISQKQLKGRKEPLLLERGKESDQGENEFFASSDEELCIVGAAIKNKQKRAEVDLDLISESFKAGEIVNLQALKQKGIVDDNTEYIKILTKGNLTKPLTIEANEFSRAAKDIVELSGGEVRKI